MKIINLQTEETPVVRKTKELCQTIVDQPGYQAMKKSIMDFLSNDDARAQYQRLCDLQESLHHKSHSGEEIPDEEIAEFERLEQAFMANPLAQGFIQAQQAMLKLVQTIMLLVR